MRRRVEGRGSWKSNDSETLGFSAFCKAALCTLDWSTCRSSVNQRTEFAKQLRTCMSCTVNRHRRLVNGLVQGSAALKATNHRVTLPPDVYTSTGTNNALKARPMMSPDPPSNVALGSLHFGQFIPYTFIRKFVQRPYYASDPTLLNSRCERRYLVF